jgi:putative ABC transport system substrate-binding protein
VGGNDDVRTVNDAGGGYLTPIEAAARESGVKVTIALSRNAAEMERAIDAFAAEPNGGMIVIPGAFAHVFGLL